MLRRGMPRGMINYSQASVFDSGKDTGRALLIKILSANQPEITCPEARGRRETVRNRDATSFQFYSKLQIVVEIAEYGAKSASDRGR